MTLSQAIIFGVLSALIVYGIIRAQRAAEISADTPPTRHQMAQILKLLIAGIGVVVIALSGAVIVFSNVAKDASQASADAEAATAKLSAVIKAQGEERAQRIDVTGKIVKYTCKDNNQQDDSLAQLIAVSLSGNDTFGEGLDLSLLTPFQVQVLGAIAAIQQLTAQDNQFQHVFEQELHQLRDLRNCEQIVTAYINGEPPPVSSLGLGRGNHGDGPHKNAKQR